RNHLTENAAYTVNQTDPSVLLARDPADRNFSADMAILGHRGRQRLGAQSETQPLGEGSGVVD
ncbi:hypothetical protein OSJ04_25640, partial [Mycobacterium ulcerans]